MDIKKIIADFILPGSVIIATGLITLYLTAEDDGRDINYTNQFVSNEETKDDMENYNNNEENIDTFIIDDDKEPMWAKELALAIKAIAEDIKEIKVNNMKTSNKIDQDDSFNIQNINNEKVSQENIVLSLEDRITYMTNAINKMEFSFGYLNLDISKDMNRIKNFQSGCKLILLYTNNIKKNRNVPRYKKISTNNISYKTELEHIIGHEEVLSSVGFVKVGHHFNWVWKESPHNIDDNTIDEVLDKFIYLLEELLKKYNL